ncbi:hypothetical protein B566_EDAN014498 [Ephemera danica]|nr:hypothetical protein B566_EDAN014498 [Ephemera danica]
MLNKMDVDEEVPGPQAAEQEDGSNAASTSGPIIALSPELMTSPREESSGGQHLSSSDSQLENEFAITPMDVDEDIPGKCQ